jgi:hypothetical protein
MKKYLVLVFMFCLMFAVSFVACSGKKDAARQIENSDKKDSSSKPEGSGDPGSGSNDSATTSSSSPASDASDKFILEAGDKVKIISFTQVPGSTKYTLALKFEREPNLSREVSIEVSVAKDSSQMNLVVQRNKVIDMDGDKKMYVVAYNYPPYDYLVFFSLTEDESTNNQNYSFNDRFCMHSKILVKSDKIYMVKKNIAWTDGTTHDYTLIG